MTKITVDPNANWIIWWGSMPLPANAEALGTITRNGVEHGALIRLANGNYVQGNAGSIRTLPQRDVRAQLQQAIRNPQSKI